MTRQTYNHDTNMKAKMLAHSPNANYEHAMKVYRDFAKISGFAVAALIIISKVI